MGDRFEHTAVERFDVDGLACVIAANTEAVCGYVQLPPGHPWRTGDGPRGDALPVSITYGPDDDGWIGFDTMYPWDAWAPDDLPEVIVRHRAERDALFAAAGIDPTVLHTRLSVPVRRQWTMPRMHDTVADLARVAVAADIGRS